MTMSDRVAVMDDGDLVQVAAPKEIYQEPDSRFVGEFIGQPTMEFFDAVVNAGDGDGVTFDIGDRSWAKQNANGLREYAGKQVEVGIRPQYITVTDDPNDGIPATHVLDEPLGDRTHSFFDTDQFGRLTVVTGPDFHGDGRQYGLQLDTERANVFDAESGVRVA